jgi:hypothetical protein
LARWPVLNFSRSSIRTFGMNAPRWLPAPDYPLYTECE